MCTYNTLNRKRRTNRSYLVIAITKTMTTTTTTTTRTRTSGIVLVLVLFVFAIQAGLGFPLDSLSCPRRLVVQLSLGHHNSRTRLCPRSHPRHPTFPSPSHMSTHSDVQFQNDDDHDLRNQGSKKENVYSNNSPRLTKTTTILARAIQQARAAFVALSSRGTRIHLIYAVVMIIIPVFFWNHKGTCSALSRHAMTFCFFGMAYDNIINALGKFIGPNQALRRLTKGRYLFHSAVMPLIFIPILECCALSGMRLGGNAIITTCFLAAATIAILESIDWIKYDSKQFLLVDQRNNAHHITHHVAGTLKYTCPNIIKCVAPAIVTTVLQIILGAALTIRNHAYASLSGNLVLFAGLTALFSATSCTRHPHIQLLLEPASLVMVWAAASSLY
jgi:hypothetical protein